MTIRQKSLPMNPLLKVENRAALMGCKPTKGFLFPCDLKVALNYNCQLTPTIV